MKQYTQLSWEERMKIAGLRSVKFSITEMAVALGRSKATISRELRRNQAPPGEYWPDTAQRLTMQRKQRVCRLDRNKELRAYVCNMLCCHYWTPEQIAASLRHHKDKRGTEGLPYVSHETIYAWLYLKPQKKEKLWKFLPRHKATRGLRKSKGAGISRIPNRVPIHERPAVVEAKQEFGHWEGDLMSFLKNSQHMVVIRERKTMFTLADRLPSKKAHTTAAKVVELMVRLPVHARKTHTLDNGGEFAEHGLWKDKLGLSVYFCDPYASWQKGGVENTNGRLRRDLPRNTNLHNLTQEDFDETLSNYNNTPRKKLGWLTPLEAFLSEINRVALHT